MNTVKPSTKELQNFASIALALKECHPELRDAAYELFSQLNSGELDEHEQESTVALIAEILFPNADDQGVPGLDLAEAEEMALNQSDEVKTTLEYMDRQEATFAERLKQCMSDKAMNQTELAQRVGIGQPAISMMLNRCCRPQKKTVLKLAEALGVEPSSLWPL